MKLINHVTVFVCLATIHGAACSTNGIPSETTTSAALATSKECSDTSMAFSIRNGPESKGCDWLRKTNERIGQHCDRVEVQRTCPKTCAICDIPTTMPSSNPTQYPTYHPSAKPSHLPTTKPTGAPSSTPSSKPCSLSPTNECTDTSMPFSIKKGPKSRGCKWLRKRRKRVYRNCDRIEVQRACPQTCHICGLNPSTTPTQKPTTSPPTVMPSSIPSQMPSPTSPTKLSITVKIRRCSD